MLFAHIYFIHLIWFLGWLPIPQRWCECLGENGDLLQSSRAQKNLASETRTKKNAGKQITGVRLDLAGFQCGALAGLWMLLCVKIKKGGGGRLQGPKPKYYRLTEQQQTNQ